MANENESVKGIYLGSNEKGWGRFQLADGKTAFMHPSYLEWFKRPLSRDKLFNDEWMKVSLRRDEAHDLEVREIKGDRIFVGHFETGEFPW
jgi:hypothetical protein